MASHRLSETYRQSKGDSAITGLSRKQTTCKQEQSRLAGNDGDNQDLWVLKHFDLTAKYGPCTNITRKQRWERAHRLKLEPPEKVMQLLQQLETEPQEQQGLWANRI